MNSGDVAPSAEDIERARRLMAGAQIQSIRIVKGYVAHTPSKNTKSSETLQVEMRATPRAAFEKGEGLKILIEYAALARRTPKADTEIELRAAFELLYRLPNGFRPKKPEIEGFAHTNAMLNSFPYWREYVQSSVARMNLPPLTLPLFRLTPPSATHEHARSTGKKAVRAEKTDAREDPVRDKH